MTGRYLIHVRRNGSRSGVESRSSMQRVFTCDAFEVWADRPVLPVGAHGCIIGHLFTGIPSTRPVASFDPDEQREIVESGATTMLRRYWGGYIAVLGSDTGNVCVLRDPSGAMPCLIHDARDAVVIASDAGLINEESQRTISVEYREVARLISGADQMGRQTCLTNIDELLPGERLIVRATSNEIHSEWCPWKFARTETKRSTTENAARLKGILLDCIGAWAAQYRHILIGVSGGLDSSTVAAITSDNCPDMRCFTMVGPDINGDETPYARLLAEALGLPLTVSRYGLDQIDFRSPVMPHLPWPVGAYFIQGIEHAHHDLQRSGPIDAFFAGNAGDGVFCSLRSAAPLADRVIAEGLGWATARTLRDVSDLTGADALTVIRMARQRIERSKKRFIPQRDILGLDVRMTEQLSPAASLHPWLAVPPPYLPGKLGHIAMITRSHKSIEFYARGERPPQISPLLSQPIVEACLEIPTWQWVTEGRDRAITRMAMTGILPDPLLRRTTKGGPDGFMHLLYRAKWRDLLDYLRDGLLVSHQVIDPAFLNTAFDPSAHGRPVAGRLLTFAAAESWARFWQ